MSIGPMAPDSRVRLARRRGFLIGVLFGCVLLVALREVVNEATFPDRIVAPLLLADTDGPADAIVVMGAGVTGPCVPNLNGTRRVLHGLRAWREGRAPVVVFSGGAAPNECPVADAMASLAREVGIPASAIHTERSSRSTKENAELTAPLLRWLGARRVLIVTDRLHGRRASGVFTQQGFQVERHTVPVYEGHIDNTSMLAAGVRELAAVYYYKMRGWIESGATAGAALEADGLPASPPSDMQVSNPSGPIVVLGASYAGGWTLERVAGIPVVNRGAPGQQSFEMLERFERDVVAARPRAVILWGFINDIFRAQDADAARARARESFTRMIALARQHGIEPIVATEVTIRPERSWMNTLASIAGAIRGKESYQARINRHVIETNQWLVDVARREGLLLLDLQSTLAEEGGTRRPEFTQADGSHITGAGYAALTEYAGPILERHLTSTR